MLQSNFYFEIKLQQGDCEDYIKFLNSSQVATCNENENLSDSLILEFAQNVTSCKYFDLDYFGNKQRKRKQLFMLNVNIHSLSKNFGSKISVKNST